jgi:hypothetical protein
MTDVKIKNNTGSDLNFSLNNADGNANYKISGGNELDFHHTILTSKTLIKISHRGYKAKVTLISSNLDPVQPEPIVVKTLLPPKPQPPPLPPKKKKLISFKKKKHQVEQQIKIEEPQYSYSTIASEKVYKKDVYNSVKGFRIKPDTSTVIFDELHTDFDALTLHL